MQLNSFFSNLKILEVSSILAGPGVGMFFAELGAKVVKIENKKTDGDPTRKWKLPEENPESEYSAYYCAANWNKEIRMADFSDKNDLNMIHSLLSDSDILITNLLEDSAKKYQLDYSSLKNLYPELIYGQITGYGTENSKPAFDLVLQAETGYLSMNGEPDRNPCRIPVAFIDLFAAHQLKEGLLIALLNRNQTNKGCKVTASLYDAGISSLANQATNWLMARHLPGPMGSLHPNIAPYGDILTAKDEGQIVLAVGSEKQFKSLCNLMNLGTLADDPKFKTNTDRLKNRDLLVMKLNSVFKEKPLQYWENRFSESGVPYGRIQNLKQVFDQPEAQSLILEEIMNDQTISRRIKTVCFQIESY